MNSKLKILHLEDLASDAALVDIQLKKAKIEHETLVISNKADYVTALKNFPADIIFADHTLPSFDSLEALTILKKTGKKIPFILITATVSEEYAAHIMREGADDYILKDRPQRLPAALVNALEKYKLIVEREEYLKKLIASEAELAFKNKELISFNQIVAHDLRSPITSIIAIADIINNMKDEKDRKVLFASLKSTALNVNEILIALVDIAKINAEVFSSENVHFQEAFNKSCAALQIISHQLNADFKTDFTRHPFIHFPRLYLESIFLNLISNSLKYYSPDRLPVITIKSYKQGEQAILEYADNGLGIDLKKFGKKIFGLSQTFHKNQERKGLGLFMIKNQIESKGGNIRVESKLNNGIKFIIEFGTFV